MMRTVIYTTLSLAVLAVAGIAAFIYSGVYNAAATEQHTAPVYTVIEEILNRSVAVRARSVEVPDLDGQDRVQPGRVDEGGDGAGVVEAGVERGAGEAGGEHEVRAEDERNAGLEIKARR